jgi:hypothetical protein
VKACSREGRSEGAASAGPGREREAAEELLLKVAAVAWPRLKERSSWRWAGS